MRRKFLAVAALTAAGMLMLTACTSSKTDKDSGQQTAAAEKEAAEKEATEKEVTEEEATEKEAVVTEAKTDSSQMDEAENKSDTGVSSGQDAQEEKQSAAADSGETAEDGTQEDIWSGTYEGEQESVTIRMGEDGTFSFTFAQSGISGTAEVDGQSAVYSGDDDHILTFTKKQGMLNVEVSHAEGYDTAASPLNGSYIPSY